jgi:hypothetical protein
MSNAGQPIRIEVIETKRCDMKCLATLKSILKGWTGHAVAVLVRLKVLAPYALIEILLPGGSVMALLLWLYRQKRSESDWK